MSELFEKIILAVKQEQEFSQTRNLLSVFLVLLFLAVAALPFTLSFFISQWIASGTSYFILAAIQAHLFFAYWQDFLLSIFESLPVMAILLVTLNMALCVFLLRLFLYKKGLILKYLQHVYGTR